MAFRGFGTLALVVALGAAQAVQAVPVSFTDVYDPRDRLMNSRYTTYKFTHDITDNGFNTLTDTLTSGIITLDLRDDSLIDPSEKVNFNFDGRNYGTYEVNFTDFSFYVDVALLQSDGKLTVTLRRKSGDFYFRSSTLVVEGDRYVPGSGGTIGGGGTPAVPEPGAVFLLGLGGATAGLLGLLRKKKEPQDRAS